MSHFEAAKDFFKSLNQNMEEFTGEKHSIDATISLGTFSVTGEKELSVSDKAKIARIARQQFIKKTKVKDITVEELK